MVDVIKNEPVLVSGLVLAAIVLLMAFGFHFSNQQIGAIMAFLSAGMALVARAFVTPVHKADPPAAP